MGEGLLLTDDLRAGDLVDQVGGAGDDILDAELELAPAGGVDLAVDELVEVVGIAVELVRGCLAVLIGGELEGGPLLGEEVGLNAVPAGPRGQHLGIGDLLAGVSGQVLDAHVDGGVDVAGLLNAELLTGTGLDALVVLTGQGVELLCLLGIPGDVGLGELLRGGLELTGLILDVGRVVRDGLVLGLLVIGGQLDGLARGDSQLGGADEVAHHVGLAGGVVGALGHGDLKVGAGAGTDVLPLGDDLQLVLGKDLELVGDSALVGDVEGDHTGGEGIAGHLAAVVGDGHGDGGARGGGP